MDVSENIDENTMIGKRVGVFELKREIGRGGMGAVYLAERVDGEFRQTVAIKLIKRGMDTDLILKRFRRERQILASLDHPNITYFLAGGSTEDGLPYFVMEYIEGKPLYRFCDENRLSVAERLKIFKQICEAVEAAHKIRVIHRDLKPSNILVKNDGVPKLLDFGIAKVLDPDLVVTDIDPTVTAMRVMTPEYASPEQIRGDDVTPASDVYSLGVILYELLTGHRPYFLKRQVPHEVARIICEEMPPRPSANLTGEDNLVPVTGGEKPLPEEVFETRRTSPAELQQAIAGDLDKIVLKALRKNPAERYKSAALLAEDIDCFLENRPVKAEIFLPKETAKILEKKSVAILPFKMIGADTSKDTEDIFLGVGLADALVSRLSGFQRLIVRPTSSVLMFADNDPIEAGKKIGVDFILDGTIRRVGDRIRVSVQLLNVAEGATVWAERFDEKFTDVLELEDSISDRAAKILLPHLTGEELRRLEKRGTNNPDAYQAYLRGRYFANQFTDEALQKSFEAYRQAVEIDPEYALPHVGIADFYAWSAIFGEMPSREGFPKAKAAAERALEIDAALGEAFAILAFITFLYEWNWTEAEYLVERALELNPNYSFAHECCSALFISQGKFEEGIGEIKCAEELDPLSPRAKLMTGWMLYQARDYSESVTKAEQATDMQANFSQGLLHLGNSLMHVGKIKEAVEALKESARLWQSALPQYLLCFALAADGRSEEARKILDELLKLSETHHVKPYFLAMMHVALGETDAAFEWFEKAVDERNEWMIWFGCDPKLDLLRKDRRYFEILKKTGNPIFERQQARMSDASNPDFEKSIAVLPFRLLSSKNAAEDSEDEYLTIGLADALTMRLSNVRRFLVRPTSSVLPFGQKNIDPFDAGRELGVDFVLDGNIRRVGSRIRVAAQLLDVEESSTIWAERFDEDFTDVLELEDSISERVTSCLLPTLTGEERRRMEKRGTSNAQAFELYMRGRYFWNRFTPDAFPKANEAFEKAVAHDPEYALAHVGIADFYNWACIYGITSPSESGPKVKAAAERALEIDPTLGEAYAALGLYYSSILEYAQAESHYQRAVELSPNYPHAHEWLGALLVGTGCFEEGVKEMRLAEKLDPLSLRTKTLTAWTTYQARLFEDSLAKAREIIALDASFPQGYLQVANSLVELGKADEAVEICRKVISLMSGSPLPVYQYCFALVASGQIERARQIVINFETRAEEAYIPPYFLALCCVAVGEIDKVFEYLEKAFEEKSHWMLWFGTEPKLDSIRGDERYLHLFSRMNNPLAEKQAAELSAHLKPKKTLAILPLRLLGSRGAEDEYLGIGLADALTTRFSNTGRFIVRPTSSTMAFRGAAETDPLIAGQRLKADHVVSGNIRRINDHIRVTMQLLSVPDKATSWSQAFDEKYKDVLDLEDSISEKIAGTLLPQLSDEEAEKISKRGTDSAPAYEAFLKGRYFWNTMVEKGFAKAIELYEEAVALDPNYALAYASLAEAYMHLGIQCFLPFDESIEKSLRAAEKAVALDPTLAEAQASLGFAILTAEYDWQTAAAYFRRAIQTNPYSTMALSWLGAYFIQNRRFEEGLAQYEKILEIEPNSLFGWHVLAWARFNARNFEQSIALHRQLVEDRPPYPFASLSYSWALIETGDFDEAIRQARIAADLAPDNSMYRAGLAAAFASAGNEDEARKILDELTRAAGEHYVSPYMLAVIHVYLNDDAKALDCLQKAAETHDAWICWLGVNPQFAALRDDPRCAEILRFINYPPVK